LSLASLSPAQAPLLLSLNGSMLYIGTALGAIISGSLLGTVSFAQVNWVGVPFGLLALLTLAFDRAPVAATMRSVFSRSDQRSVIRHPRFFPRSGDVGLRPRLTRPTSARTPVFATF
jgi:MFS family permease